MKPDNKKGMEWDGGRVRALRYHLEMSQEELSDELGVRQQTISEWETGMYRPRGASLTLLNMIAERSGFRYRVRRKRSPGGSQ